MSRVEVFNLLEGIIYEQQLAPIPTIHIYVIGNGAIRHYTATPSTSKIVTTL